MTMFSDEKMKMISDVASDCKSYALVDSVVSTQVNLKKLCRGLRPLMLYDVAGSVFTDRDDDDHTSYQCKLVCIGEALTGKLKANYLPQGYFIKLKPTESQDPLVDAELENTYKQFLMTGVAEEVSVWAQFTDRDRFLSPDGEIIYDNFEFCSICSGCKEVPQCAFAVMCLCLGMRHKLCPWSIFEMICERWPAEGERCRGDMKKIMNERFLACVVRGMGHGEVEVLKLWDDKCVENVEKIAEKGEKLVSLMNSVGVVPLEME